MIIFIICGPLVSQIYLRWACLPRNNLHKYFLLIKLVSYPAPQISLISAINTSTPVVGKHIEYVNLIWKKCLLVKGQKNILIDSVQSEHNNWISYVSLCTQFGTCGEVTVQWLLLHDYIGLIQIEQRVFYANSSNPCRSTYWNVKLIWNKMQA